MVVSIALEAPVYIYILRYTTHCPHDLHSPYLHTFLESLRINFYYRALPADVPPIQVDAHNIVPVWITSDKQENTPHFFRKKIFCKLDEYLTEYPPVVRHPHKSVLNNVPKNDWIKCWKHVKVEDLDEVEWATPGYKAGIRQLELFCLKRSKDYATKRNDPLANVTSDLSPWFHFGMITFLFFIKSKKNAKIEFFFLLFQLKRSNITAAMHPSSHKIQK